MRRPSASPILAVLILLAGSHAGLPAQTQHTLYALDGRAKHDLFGICVCGLGDLNGDGRPDYAVGAYEANAGTGEVRVFSGATGLELFTLHGDSAGDRFGCAVASAGDTNGDGVPDILVGAYHDDDNGTDSGSARLFSGKDGSILFTLLGEAASDEFGTSVAGAGDVDKDGRADVIVGAPLSDKNGSDAGTARVFSGRTGKVLHTFVGDAANDWFGYSVSTAGDIDRDGCADLFVGACYADTLGRRNNGIARVYSGKSGAVIHTFHGGATSDWLGVSVDTIGDIDHDGVPDLVAGATMSDEAGTNAGSATVFSGRTGKLMLQFFGRKPGDEFGVSVHGCGDFDGDSVPDLVVGAYRGSSALAGAGSVYVISGSDGSTILTCNGVAVDDRLGVSVGALGDVNGDGYADVIAGAVYSDRNGKDAGSAFIYSGAPLALVTDRPTLSSAMGGTQTLFLDAGKENAGRSYLVLGSVSGTSPGIPLGKGLFLPLRPDSYTDWTLANANSAALVNTLGQLDAAGQATASLNFPTSDVDFFGLTLYHAYAVYDAKRVYMVSNPVTLTFDH